LTNILGIGTALIITCIVINLSSLNWTIYNTGLLLVGVLIIVMMGFISQYARKEAWQMIDLWLCGAFSDELGQVLGKLEESLSIEHPNDNGE
jgi:hypothetical protein